MAKSSLSSYADTPTRFPSPSGQGLRQLEQERAGLQVIGIHLPNMKARHYLQVSSAIIGKHRHRSDVTGMTTSIYSPSEVVVRCNDCANWDKKGSSIWRMVGPFRTTITALGTHSA
jgi:hypothetical protein